jgi:hypothetical protein
MLTVGRIRPRRTSGVFDWIVSTATVDSAGAPVAASAAVATFGGSLLIPAASFGTWQAAVVNPTPMSSTPSVGRLRIDELAGHIYFNSNAAAQGSFAIAVAAYVSDLNNTTTLWNVRNPMNPTDASRDDYLFLEGLEFESSGQAAQVSGPLSVGIKLSLSQPVVIGGGQALHVVVANQVPTKGSGDTGQSVVANAFFRTRVGPVA